MSRRLLIVAPGRAHGGCERYAVRMARGATDRGRRCTLASPAIEATASVRADARAAGAAWVRWPCGTGPTLEDWGTAREQADAVATVLSACSPDAVLLALPSPLSALGALAALGGASVPVTAVFQLCARPLVVPRAERAAVANAAAEQCWAAPSRQCRDAVAATFGLPASRIHVIPNGTDPPTGSPRSVERRLDARA